MQKMKYNQESKNVCWHCTLYHVPSTLALQYIILFFRASQKWHHSHLYCPLVLPQLVLNTFCLSTLLYIFRLSQFLLAPSPHPPTLFFIYTSSVVLFVAASSCSTFNTGFGTEADYWGLNDNIAATFFIYMSGNPAQICVAWLCGPAGIVSSTLQHNIDRERPVHDNSSHIVAICTASRMDNIKNQAYLYTYHTIDDLPQNSRTLS